MFALLQFRNFLKPELTSCVLQQQERARRMAAEEQIAVEKQKAEILNERFQVTVASEAKLRDELDRLFARFNDQLDLQQRSQTAHANVIFDATERVAINSLQINGAMHEQVTKRTEAEAAVVQLERTLEQTSDHAAHELRSVQEQLHAAHEHADTLWPVDKPDIV